MSQEKTLHQAIGDELALSDNKADEVITPWSGIVEAFRDNRLTLGNRIKPETYEARAKAIAKEQEDDATDLTVAT